MKKFTWAHGIITALGLFIAFILYLIFIFPIGKQNSELVTETYYDDELAYQQVINAKKNAESLPAQPLYTQNTEGIKISFPEELANAEKIKFHLYRTNDKTLDIQKEVSLNAQKSFEIPKKVLTKGAYTLKLHWEKDKKNYQIDYDVEWN